MTCLCRKHGVDRAPLGLTHPKDQPCPFAEDHFPQRLFGSCCSFDGKTLARELEAIAFSTLGLLVYHDKHHHHAEDFGLLLAQVAGELEAKHADDIVKPKGAGWNGTMGGPGESIVWERHSTFEEALDCIRQGSRWYRKVAKLGFGVKAAA